MESLSAGIEFLAFSDVFLHSPRSGCPRPAVQFIQTGAIYQRVVIPAKAGIHAFLTASWIPACAGMTDQRPFEKVNSDKADK